MNNEMHAQLEMFRRLEAHVTNGIPIFVSGVLSTPEEVVKNVILNEESIYMADFVEDDNGCLQQICYDRIVNY